MNSDGILNDTQIVSQSLTEDILCFREIRHWLVDIVLNTMKLIPRLDVSLREGLNNRLSVTEDIHIRLKFKCLIDLFKERESCDWRDERFCQLTSLQTNVCEEIDMSM